MNVSIHQPKVPGWDLLRKQRGLLVVAPLLVAGAVAWGALALSWGAASRPSDGRAVVASTPAPRETTAVFYVVSSEDEREAILRAEAAGASDAVALGGKDPQRQVFVLVATTPEEEWQVMNVLYGLDERSLVINTRSPVPPAPGPDPATYDLDCC